MNSGKVFENAFKKSIPDYVLYHRLNDSTGTFSGGSNLRFSPKQPCDAFLWNGQTNTFYSLELKTSKSGSFSYEDINCEEKQTSKMIHKHQILSLDKLSKYDGVVSGFIFNFRDESESFERTYFQEICDFLSMIGELNKKSFNEKDLLEYSPVQIIGRKKIKNWTWNVEKFLNDTRLN
ncbi:hypothetical protein AALB39_04525 [Lachnospiraceae bacterium 54-53]